MTWRSRLKKAGLKQHEVATALGTSESRLSRVLHGRATLQPDEVKKLARLLRITVEEVRRLVPLAAH